MDKDLLEQLYKIKSEYYLDYTDANDLECLQSSLENLMQDLQVTLCIIDEIQEKETFGD